MERKQRKDCFFGLHYDFHAEKTTTGVGKNTTEADIREIINTVKPDFIQCDSKGHPGIASYPTKVGTPAPDMAKDNLRIWRNATADAGIPLFLHYSGVYDAAAVQAHPEWAVINQDGKANRDFTSPQGGYVDELLIPQLCEVAQEYGADGAWIDGEAWAVQRDYSEAIQQAFYQETGLTSLPKTPEDEGFEAYMDLLRKHFRQYLQHYTQEIHKKHPQFQIASNWAFTTMMPEKVCADVDFLSGDYSPLDSYNTSRFESRYLATQGKPWDLMGWSFVMNFGDSTEICPSTKSACQISREAAAPLSLGGGFQAYVLQHMDGSPESWMLPVLAEVSQFCNARKEKCFRAENVPQVAVLLSTHNLYRVLKMPFGSGSHYLATQGIVQVLLDNQFSVHMISEHHLQEDLMKYPVLVLPETAYLEEETIAMLRTYMEQGGHLIAAGPMAARHFVQEAGVQMANPFTDKEWDRLAHCTTIKEVDATNLIPKQVRDGGGWSVDWEKNTTPAQTMGYLAHRQWLAGVYGLRLAVTPLEGTEVIGRMYLDNAFTGPSTPAATTRAVKKGSCTCVWVNTGEKYCTAQKWLVRDFWGDLVKRWFQPMVRIADTHLVDVNISRKNGELLVHLINTSGNHASERTYTYDEIAPLYNLKVTVDCPVRPESVETVPGQLIAWNWADGVLEIDLPKLDIYTILAIH